MKNISQIAFFLIVIACTGFFGVWLGKNIFMPREHITSEHTNSHAHDKTSDMHSMLHDKLNITDAQEVQLADIEKEMKHLKSLYQGQMKTANMELAQAIKKGGYESDEIEPIVHKIHKAMGDLQALSLKHLADMQKVLDEEQNKKLQEMVVEQLQRNAGE